MRQRRVKKPRPTAIGCHGAGQDLDEGGFARAVLADERADLPGLDGEVEIRQHGNAAVQLPESVGVDHH